jgi:hypothetical protein
MPFITYLFNSNAQVFNWITDVIVLFQLVIKRTYALIFTDANSSKSPLFAQILTLDFAIWAEIMWLQ